MFIFQDLSRGTGVGMLVRVVFVMVVVCAAAHPLGGRLLACGTGNSADRHLPHLGTALQIVPLELSGPFCGECVVERLGIVIVDQKRRAPNRQLVEGAKDGRVLLRDRYDAGIYGYCIAR